jgi:hypothetical protein
VILNIPFAPSVESANAGPECWICIERDEPLSNRNNMWFKGSANAEFSQWTEPSVEVARHLSEKVSEAPTVCSQTAQSPRTVLLSSIIWREFCSSPLLAGTLQCFCVREESSAFDLGSAHHEQSSEFTNRVFGNIRD